MYIETNYDTRDRLAILAECNDKELSFIFNEIKENKKEYRESLVEGNLGYTIYCELSNAIPIDTFVSYLYKEMAERFCK